ncbi:hypothetical protein ACIHEI_24415 [Kitasatospora sp. NPDC051984]|uniref:hypothetical protein n=1 Tax=Kitasatospora sp. NPDC051984 TaxID=3364059 RepID=UPI0037C7630A
MVTAHVDQQLAQLRTALPWATHLGTTVADICETYPANTGFTRRTWTPVMCTRTGTAYLAFDGDFREHLAQLDTALADEGWKPTNNAGDQPGLVADLDYTHRPPGDATAAELAKAAARPNVATVRYTLPIPSAFAVPPGAGGGPFPIGTVEVAQAPTCRPSTTERPRTT